MALTKTILAPNSMILGGRVRNYGTGNGKINGGGTTPPADLMARFKKKIDSK